MVPSESPGAAQLCQTTLSSFCLKSQEPAVRSLSHVNSGKQSLLHRWLLTGRYGFQFTAGPYSRVYCWLCALFLCFCKNDILGIMIPGPNLILQNLRERAEEIVQSVMCLQCKPAHRSWGLHCERGGTGGGNACSKTGRSLGLAETWRTESLDELLSSPFSVRPCSKTVRMKNREG